MIVKFILLSIIIYSCSTGNGIHDSYLIYSHKRMIKEDQRMKNAMITHRSKSIGISNKIKHKKKARNII